MIFKFSKSQSFYLALKGDIIDCLTGSIFQLCFISGIINLYFGSKGNKEKNTKIQPRNTSIPFPPPHPNPEIALSSTKKCWKLLMDYFFKHSVLFYYLQIQSIYQYALHKTFKVNKLNGSWSY